jgi:hypothetical protein
MLTFAFSINIKCGDKIENVLQMCNDQFHLAKENFLGNYLAVFPDQLDYSRKHM